MLHLGHFLEPLTDYQTTGKEPAVSSVCVDSRQVKPGSVFVAFAGENTDGHAYVADAFSRGAVAAMIERPIAEIEANAGCTVVDARRGGARLPDRGPICLLVNNTLTALQTVAGHWRARFDVRVIGITGSVGKTSTKELTHAVLSRRFRALKSPGNQNNEIGLPISLLNLRPYHERAVLEMGMYARGEIADLCRMARPHIGVVTMIGPVHLERLGSMEAIVAAKRELVEALPADGAAVLNKDDPRVMGMAPYTPARIFTYGLDAGADLWADNIYSMGLDGIRFTLHYRDEALSVRAPLLGRHSVHTALRAAAVGLIEGLSWDEIVTGLTALSSQLRLVVIPGPRNSVLIDDTYNSSPDSALAALNLLNDLDGRHVAVLGDMLELGQAEEEGHRLVGRRAADVADVLVAVGPRAATIASEALAVGMPDDRVFRATEAQQAVPVLEEIIREGDVVLIKGSLGMRMERIVGALGRMN